MGPQVCLENRKGWGIPKGWGVNMLTDSSNQETWSRRKGMKGKSSWREDLRVKDRFLDEVCEKICYRLIGVIIREPTVYHSGVMYKYIVPQLIY